MLQTSPLSKLKGFYLKNPRLSSGLYFLANIIPFALFSHGQYVAFVVATALLQVLRYFATTAWETLSPADLRSSLVVSILISLAISAGVLYVFHQAIPPGWLA